MINNFDRLCNKLLKECGMTDIGVMGATGASYADGDARVPKLLMPIMRRNPRKKKKKK